MAESAESEGEFAAPEEAPKFRFVFGNEQFSTSNAGTMHEGTYDIDVSARPMTLKMHMENGNEAFALFEFRGEKLVIHFASADDPPPTDFKTAPGASGVLLICNRQRR